MTGVLQTDDLGTQRYALPLLADERLELTARELQRVIAERADIAPPDAVDD